jgi:mannitol/fructose-specific phosphotransferase system IIA component (Ntr-type)
MISIRQILQPGHVNLFLSAMEQPSAVEEVLTSLRGDIRVLDWNALRVAVVQRNAPAISASPCGIVIAHGRTNAVNSLVMAAGRTLEGLNAAGIPELVRLVFVVGIPAALNNEYLRVVGTIARLCSKPDIVGELLATTAPDAFIEMFAASESAL